MQTAYAGEPLADPDLIIREVVKERGGQPIRLRLPLTVLRDSTHKGAQYMAWRDQVWAVDCDTAAEALALRDALRAFFATLNRIGPVAVRDLLVDAEEAEGVAGGQPAQEERL